jgi:hypothetical protein
MTKRPAVAKDVALNTVPVILPPRRCIHSVRDAIHTDATPALAIYMKK